jgi:hypothetical protein
MAQLFANAAHSVLTASIAATDMALQINPADAGKFPVAASSDWFKVALQDSTGNIEYVQVQRAVGQSILTVMTRAVEDSATFPARSFAAGSLVELRMTAADIASSIAHPSVNVNAHAATAISVTPTAPTGGIASTDVQSALEELDTKKFAKSDNLPYGQLTGAPPRYVTCALVVGFWPTAPTGTLPLDGNTIGNASSGATSRANADTQALFDFLWTSFPYLVVQDNTGTPVSRGATADDDFNAGHRLALPQFNDGDALLMAVTTAVLTRTHGQMPIHNHTLHDPGHAHGTGNWNVPAGGINVFNVNANSGSGGANVYNQTQPNGTGISIDSAGVGTDNMAAGTFIKGYIAL